MKTLSFSISHRKTLSFRVSTILYKIFLAYSVKALLCFKLTFFFFFHFCLLKNNKDQNYHVKVYKIWLLQNIWNLNPNESSLQKKEHYRLPLSSNIEFIESDQVKLLTLLLFQFIKYLDDFFSKVLKVWINWIKFNIYT